MARVASAVPPALYVVVVVACGGSGCSMCWWWLYVVVVVEYNSHIHMHTQQAQTCTDGADKQEQTRTHTRTHVQKHISKDLKRTHSMHGSAHTVSGVSQVEVNVPCMWHKNIYTYSLHITACAHTSDSYVCIEC